FRLGDASLADRVDQTMQIVRRIASELRPSVLDQLGLEAAIEALVRETTQRTGIAVCFHADDFPRLPDEIASHAYRIIQEALTNVSRHSKATRVDVSVRRVGGVIILGVEDNGVGFTPQSLSGLRSLGLVGIRERALACGGALMIRGEPGQRTGQPTIRVLAVSVHPEDEWAVRALRAGASGYLTKDHSPDQLLDAIRRVYRGGKYVSPTLAEQLAKHLDAGGQRPPHELLSDREFEVMRRLGSGLTVSQIASELALSAKTVSTYRTRILEKMAVTTNADLVRYAARYGLIA